MKVWVYAICKNEAQFARRWADSMKEADGITVLDTGSTDNTLEILQALGVQVHRETIVPWRFDLARNRSLDLVPKDVDICVCTDLDEVFVPGWCETVKKAWTPDTTQLRYRYTWSFTPEGKEDVVFYAEKIHARHGFRWKHPVHEVLCSAGAPVKQTLAPGVQLNHYPDPNKSRGQYLPLLEFSVQEDPTDDRNLHYLGREYFYYGRYEESIATLTRHLSLPSAIWVEERAASLGMIGQCHEALGHPEEAHTAFLQGAAQAPHLRESWLELARFYYRHKRWDGVIFACQTALAITTRPMSYITRGAAYAQDPYDLLSLGYYYTGQYEKANAAVTAALAFTPNDKRLQENQNWILQALQKQ